MRGKDEQQLDVFSYISPEQRVPHRRVLRMDEDDRAVAEGSASWNLQRGMGLHLCGRGLQLSPYEESGDSSNVGRVAVCSQARK
jgi:hypothetical protein